MRILYGERLSAFESYFNEYYRPIGLIGSAKIRRLSDLLNFNFEKCEKKTSSHLCSSIELQIDMDQNN